MNAYNSSEDRERVLKRMQEADVAADVCTWNTLMKTYHNFDERLAVIMRMMHQLHPCRRCFPSFVTYLTLLSAADVRDHHVKLRALEFFQHQSDHHLRNHKLLGKLLRICADSESIVCMDRFWKIGNDRLRLTSEGWPGESLSKQLNDLSRNTRHKAGWRHLSHLLDASHTGLVHTDESRRPSDGATREGSGSLGRGASAIGGAAAAAPRVAPHSSLDRGGSRLGSGAAPSRP
jgi:hypothetical protein